MKKLYIQTNVGTAKYLVNHHDGIKKHDDGSEFFDVTIFKNKKKLGEFVATLKNNGYIERGTQTTYDQVIHNCSPDKETFFDIGVNYDNTNRIATYTNLTTKKTWKDDLKINHSMRYVAKQVS